MYVKINILSKISKMHLGRHLFDQSPTVETLEQCVTQFKVKIKKLEQGQ